MSGRPPRRPYQCEAEGCNELGDGPMLRDELWAAIAPRPDRFPRFQGEPVGRHGPAGPPEQVGDYYEAVGTDGRASGRLCMACMERRLGRPLVLEDLTSARMNRSIRTLLERLDERDVRIDLLEGRLRDASVHIDMLRQRLRCLGEL